MGIFIEFRTSLGHKSMTETTKFMIDRTIAELALKGCTNFVIL